jgi:rod shape-determining protein MreC
MRNEGITKFLIIASAVLVLLIGFNFFALHAVRRQYAVASRATASLFDLAGQAREWLGYIKEWQTLATENAMLKDNISKYVSAEATIQSLQSENDILKKDLGLSNKLKRHLLPAGLFGISLTPDGYQAFINKGSSSGVEVGQTVASSNGELVGRVAVVFPSTARVALLTDPSFSVTAQILNGQTSGIIRGALTDGLNFDLITQADTIAEGDIIITAGDDTTPAGLVVGTVRSIDSNDTKLFKKVSVNPALTPGQGSVVVIQP